jgi:hypothetical protein
MSFPLSIEISVNIVDWNAESSMNYTLRGITIDSRELSENALDSIHFSPEFDSTEINKSVQQSEKHDEQRISTVRGITIGSNDHFTNAENSIRFNPEFNANESDESE